MSQSTFLTTAAKRIAELGRTYGLDNNRAFLVWASGLLWGLEEEDAVEAVMDKPNDKHVDLFWYDDVSDRILIAQSKYPDSPTKTPKVRDLNAFPSCLGWLAQPEALEREGRPDLADAARQFVELRDRDVAVELWFVYFSPAAKNLEKEAAIFNEEKRNRDQRIQLRLVPLEVLRAKFEDLENVEDRVPRDTLAVTWVEPQAGRYGKALVATVKGNALAVLYRKHANKLFARNVRLFLGQRKGSVNEGIANTLQDVADRGNFWAYNNGVTIVCHDFKYRELSKTIDLRNFSIVNGCQTTVLLSEAVDSLTEDVEVLVKVVCPDNRAIDRIIEFTNSQNQIRTWDIKSQDRVQRRLKEEIEALATPFFYAIRKGEFEALPPLAKKKYKSNGKKRAIRFDSLAQYLAAFQGSAYYAYKFKARLFETLYREIFPEDINARNVVFIWQIGEMVREFVREKLTEASANGEEQRVRILKKGCRIYLLAVLSTVLQLRNGATYLSKIADGNPIGQRREEKLRKYCEWALDWYEEAVAAMIVDGKQDLGTLVRQEKFLGDVTAHAKKGFERQSRAPRFFDEALPPLLPVT